MARDYSKDLKEIKNNIDYKNIGHRKRFYKENRKIPPKRLLEQGLAYATTIDPGSLDTAATVDARATAYNLMEIEEPEYFFAGAETYARLGKLEKAKVKLVEVAKKASQHGKMNNSDYHRLTTFLKKEDRKGGPKNHDLEGRVAVFMFLILGGIVLSATSIKATGNVIGSLTGTTPGLLGIFLFIFGLAGLAFGLNR